MAAQKEQLTAVVKRKTEENSALHRRLHGLGFALVRRGQLIASNNGYDGRSPFRWNHSHRPTCQRWPKIIY
jgi:hypothetical protein